MRSLALALAGMALARPACCMKEELDIEEDYRRAVVVDNFGFHKNGQINLKMKELQVSAVAAACSSEGAVAREMELPDVCWRTHGWPHLPVTT
jgi:polysaccharide deacetylase 2 family uncharacterized protein YibQ